MCALRTTIENNIKIKKYLDIFVFQSIRSYNINHEEKILVNFFATWCQPCRAEHIYIKRFSKENGIRIIAKNGIISACS